MSNGIEDQLIDAFKQDDQLMVKDGGQKINLWQSAAKAAKDLYYQSLFSGGEKFMPRVEKTLGAESKHQVGLLLRYMSGSGEDIPLSEDQGMIDEYLQTVDKTTEDWKPTTNRELNPNTGIPYADEGWEYTQVDPRKIMKDMGIERGRPTGGGTTSEEWNAIYDKLGRQSTVRRRKLEGGDHEYMIVEPWDLIRGTGEVDEESWLEEADYFTGGREVSKALGFLHKFAPDFLSAKSGMLYQEEEETTRIQMNLSDYGKDWLKNKAKPFNITGRSIIR